MILADSLEQMLQRRRAERKQREQQEQRREMYTEFSMWNERRLQAEQAGQPFEEPIPGSAEFNDQEAARRDLDLAR